MAWEDPASNFVRTRELLGRSGIAPGDLVVLPEMFDTGFSMNTSRTHDRGATLDFLVELARDFRVSVQGGRTVAGAEGERAINEMTATACGADGSAGVVARYAKIHPFSLGREHEHFQAGRGVVTYAWRAPAGELRVCPAICYDLRFPELFRQGLDAGAEVFALGACWPAARASHWRALALARAIENQAYMLAVNRTGRDPVLEYAGGTIAISPTGDVLGELGAGEGVLSVEVDPGAVSRWRAKFPAWRDRVLGLAPPGLQRR